jgi:hypothetical protein
VIGVADRLNLGRGKRFVKKDKCLEDGRPVCAENQGKFKRFLNVCELCKVPQ